MDINVFVNFAVVMTTMTLALTLLRLEIRVVRLVVLSTISAIYLMLFDDIVLYDINIIIISIFVSIGMSYDKGIRALILCVLTNVFISALFALVSKNLSALYNQTSTTPLVLAMAILIIAGIIEALIRLIGGYIKKQKNSYKIELIYNNSSYFSTGFYDSGNIAKKDGKPVIIISKELADTIAFSPTDSVLVMTVAGIKTLKIAPMQLKLYFDDDNHTLYEVLGATTNFSKKSSVILNAEMRRYL